MGIRWKTFEMPKRLEVEQGSLTPNYGKFIAEPFERGYGTTIGNALRRVLISSIDGAAVTSIKIDGMLHEFSAVEGVVEDGAQIVMNATTGTNATRVCFQFLLMSLNANAPMKRPIIRPPQ